MTNSIEPDPYSPELGDWRLMTTAWAIGADGALWDTPRAMRGSTWFTPIKGNEFSFATPSAAALHLNAAWRAAHRAQDIKERLAIHVFMNEQGHYSMQASDESIAALFDYFEEMISVAFGSYGSLEAYCNQVIVERSTKPITLKRRKGSVSLSATDAEREASTEEKLKRIVPDLLDIPTPCGKSTWNSYLQIKKVRDAVTHFKRHDQMRHADRAHEPTVLLDLYTLDCFVLPEAAMTVLEYLQSAGLQRWMVNPGWKRRTARDVPPRP